MLVDMLALKLHVDRGVVWGLRGNGRPVSTRLRPCDVFNSKLFRDAHTVRVVGSRQNAELIVGLYERKLQNKIKSVQTVTPLVCSTAADRLRPEAVLYHMRRFNKAPSLGGYHEVTEDDFITYALAVAVDKCDVGMLSDEASQLLIRHPAWSALTFISGLHVRMPACARLISRILDPRWYIDLCNPDRGAKLEAYLGLNPKTQTTVINANGTPWRQHDNCAAVYSCWHSDAVAEASQFTFAKHGIEDITEDAPIGLRPGDFLWRIRGRHMGFVSDKPQQPVKAALRASQRLVAFLRLTWLARLYSSYDHGGDGLFRAADFFPYVVEANAFNHHILKC